MHSSLKVYDTSPCTLYYKNLFVHFVKLDVNCVVLIAECSNKPRDGSGCAYRHFQ